MPASGRIQRRLSAAIVLTALIPLLGAVYLANIALTTTSERFFRPEIGQRLDEALGLYQELAHAQKAAMRSAATALAERPSLAAALSAGDTARLRQELSGALGESKDIVSLSVVRGPRTLASVDRGRPVDSEHELTLEVRRPIGAGTGKDDDADDSEAELSAVFSADKARYDSRDRLSEFVETYSKVVARRNADIRTYLLSFAILLGVTIALAIAVGTLLARSVAGRVERLAQAARRVGAGDLTTRVDEAGGDELSDLAGAFNRMLADVESNRARIEYLQRIGAWQEMARRLAHEIKNPLTPILLAVEEIHQRYSGADPSYRKVLDATLEVVQAEVGTLRRLVGEFSSFARLPQAHLEPADLNAFLREQAQQPLFAEDGVEGRNLPNVVVSFEVPESEAPANLDRQMLRRVLVNLVQNSAQAIRDQGRTEGKIRVAASRSGDYWVIDVDDDGPGIPVEQRSRVFDPYVTTKEDGTGLGLAIVKKIVVEHGGVIAASEGALGGARMRVTIPVSGSHGATAVLEGELGSSPEGPPTPSSARSSL